MIDFPRTPEEVLKEYGSIIEPVWGNTPLQDPVANRSSNLVRLMTAASIGQSDMEYAFEAFVQRGNIAALEGDLLTAAAAFYGITRKTETLSKTTIMVTGEFCSVLTAGSELVDRFGMPWIVQNDIELITRGLGCAFGQGIACAKDFGTFTLANNELKYDNSMTPHIYAATNGVMLEIGGAQESDQSLRNRILGRGPLARVNGTTDSTISAILASDGVNFARYASVESCIGNGPMFVVHGGSDMEICDAIQANAGLGACALIGSTECASLCSDVRFQRPCPILVCLRVVLNCDCPEQDIELVRNQILSAAPRIALQQRISNIDIAKLNSSITRVTLQKKKMPLESCADDPMRDPPLPVIIDPIDDMPIIWGTSNPYGICGGTPDCKTDPVFKQEIRVHHWQYPIIDSNFIEITKDCSEVPAEDCEICP